MWGDWVVSGINNAGQVVGSSGEGSGAYAFLWQNGTMQLLGTLNAPYNVFSGASAINNFGQVVGSSYGSGSYNGHAFLWQNNTMQDLGTLGGTRDRSVASGINNVGIAVGYSDQSGVATSARAVLWCGGGLIQDLGTLPGQATSSANAINDANQVVGASGNGVGLARPVLWQNGSMQELANLKPGIGIAFDINNAGQVVGYIQDKGFLWQNGNIQYIDPLPGDNYCVASGINESGVVVGYSYETINYSLRSHAFVWEAGMSKPQALGALSGDTWSAAFSINDQGQIVGLSGDYYQVASKGVLWNPIPEPAAAMSLASLALLGFAWMRCLTRCTPAAGG